MELDLGKYKLTEDTCRVPTVKPKIIVVKQGDDWFIKGPLPGAWMSTAAKLSGSHTLHVALAIQYANGFHKGTEVELKRFHLDRFGVKKDSTRRALERLKEAGLIDYVKDGQKYKVEILEVCVASNNGQSD